MTTPREINPYASPAGEVEEATVLALPRRWFLWMLCDSIYLSSFCLGLIGAPLSALVFLLASFGLSGDFNVFREGMTLAIVMGICSLLQSLVAGVVFGLILGSVPHLPVIFTRLLAVLLPLLVHPLAILLMRFGSGGPSSLATLAGVATSSLCIAYGLFMAGQNVNLFLAPIGRLRRDPHAPLGQLAVSEWMRRAIDVELPEGKIRVDYDGRKLGSERVLLNGNIVGRGVSVFQLAPRFEFTAGPRRCELHVTGWPWMSLRSLVLAVDGAIVYAEGF